MQITFLTDNPDSWILPYIELLKAEFSKKHEVSHVFKAPDIKGGTIMFMLSCERIIPLEYLKLHQSNVVIHPSKLPQGKGWSPLTYQVLDGKTEIPVTMFEATEALDAGDVYALDYIKLEGHELLGEIKHQQGLITMKLAKYYVENYPLPSTPQNGEESFYSRRRPKASMLDPNKTIAEQFNLLRVVDNERYPAYFLLGGKKYVVKIFKGE